MPGHPIGVGVREVEAFHMPAAERALPANKKGTIATWPGKPGDSPWQDECYSP